MPFFQSLTLSMRSLNRESRVTQIMIMLSIYNCGSKKVAIQQHASRCNAIDHNALIASSVSDWRTSRTRAAWCLTLFRTTNLRTSTSTRSSPTPETGPRPLATQRLVPQFLIEAKTCRNAKSPSRSLASMVGYEPTVGATNFDRSETFRTVKIP